MNRDFETFITLSDRNFDAYLPLDNYFFYLKSLKKVRSLKGGKRCVFMVMRRKRMSNFEESLMVSVKWQKC